MKHLLKLSSILEKRIIIASASNYRAMVEMYEKALTLATDVYDEIPEAVQKPAQALLQMARRLTDKAWKDGISAAQISFSKNKFKNQAFQVQLALSAHPNPTRQRMVNDFLAALGKVQEIDTSATKAPGEAYMAPKDEFWGTDESPDLTSEPYNVYPGLQPGVPNYSPNEPGASEIALEGVVRSLVGPEREIDSPKPWKNQ